MRVKIGDTWHEVEKGKPIAIELDSHDKCDIAEMLPDATRIGYYHDDDQTTKEEKLEWLNT